MPAHRADRWLSAVGATVPGVGSKHAWEGGPERYASVRLDDDGHLVIEVHVLAQSDDDEYEAVRTLTSQEAAHLGRLLGDPEDLVAAVAERFPSERDLSEYLIEHDLAGRFWNRIGW